MNGLPLKSLSQIRGGSSGNSPASSSGLKSLSDIRAERIAKQGQDMEKTHDNMIQDESSYVNPPFIGPPAPKYQMPRFDVTQSPLIQQVNNPVPQPPRNVDMRTDYPGGWLNPLNDLGRLSNSAILRSFDNAAGHAMGVPDDMMQPAKSTGNKYLDKGLSFAGTSAGFLVNPAMPVGNLSPVSNFFENPKIQQIANMAGNRAQRLLPDAGLAVSRDGTKIVDSLLGKTVNKATTGAVQGGLGAASYAPFQTLSSGQDIQDIPRNMLEQGAGGLALGGVLGGLGPSVSKGFKAIKELRSAEPEISRDVFNQSRGAKIQESTGGVAKPGQAASDYFNYNLPENVQSRAESSLEQYKLSMDSKYNSANQDINVWDRMTNKEKGRMNQLSQAAGTETPKPARNLEPPTPQNASEIIPVDEPVTNNRRFVDNMRKSGTVSDETLNKMEDTTYEQKPNAETLDNADKFIEENGVDGSRRAIMEKDLKDTKGRDVRLSDEETAVGFRLLGHYESIGDHASAAAIADRLAKSGTENGRAVQINALFRRLTPEGTARFMANLAQRHGNTLTGEQLNAGMQAARMYQTKAANHEMVKEVISIISKLAEGKPITAAEADSLKRMASLAKKTVPKDEIKAYTDLTGKKVTKEVEPVENITPPATEPRIRDAVTDTLSKLADKAMEREKARGNTLNSLPLDRWADHVIIGASKIANGAKKFADFSEKITDALGQKSYTQMTKLYVDSMTKFRNLSREKYTDENGKIKYRQKEKISSVEKLVSQALSTHGIKNDSEIAYALRAKAIELAHMTGRDKQQAEAILHQQFSEIVKPDFGDKLSSLLRSAQLLNGRTTIRNVIGNMMFYALDTNMRRIGSVIDTGASLKNGNKQIFWRNAPDIWKHFFGDVVYGAKEGWNGRNPGGFASQYDLGNNAFKRNGNWAEKTGSFLERSLGAINKSFDYASAKMAMDNELFQLSQAKAHAEGYRGSARYKKAQEYMATADDKMLAAAKDYGDYMTFQDKNFASDAAQALKNKFLNFNQSFGLGNIILNYPKTPANILMRAVDYSPAGYLKFVVNATKMAMNKGVDKKTLIQDFVRASGGTALGFVAYQLANAGLINVLPSKKAEVNSLEKSAGVIPNSVNVDGFWRYAKSGFQDKEAARPQKGDLYASMDWAQPMSISASAGAAMAQATDPTRMNKGLKAADATEQALEGALESAQNMTVLKSISQALTGNSNNPNQTGIGRAEDIIKQVPTSFIPSVVGQLRNTMDPNVRDTYQGGFFNQMKDSITNKLPGASKTLDPRYDTFGKEMESKFGVVGRALNAFLNPSIIAKYDPSPAAKAVLDTMDQTGNTKIAPNFAGKSITLSGQTIPLTPKQQQDLQQIQGKLIESNLSSLINALNKPNLTNFAKEKLINGAITNAGEQAKAQLLVKNPNLIQQAKKQLIESRK